MTRPRQPEVVRDVAVLLPPESAEAGPFDPLPDMSDSLRLLIFGVALTQAVSVSHFSVEEPQQPQNLNTGPSSTNPATATDQH